MPITTPMTRFAKNEIRPVLKAADLFYAHEQDAIDRAFEDPRLKAFHFRYGWSHGEYTVETTQGPEFIFQTDDPLHNTHMRWQDLREFPAAQRLALADVAIAFASNTRIQTYLERIDPSPFHDKESMVEILLMPGCMIVHDDQFHDRQWLSTSDQRFAAICCTMVAPRAASDHEALRRMKSLQDGYTRYCEINRILLKDQISNNIQMKPPIGSDWSALRAQD